MLYKKNVGPAERVARALGGGLMIACGLFASLPGWTGPGLISAGALTIVTGMFGFCPACAAIGRRPVEERLRAD